MSERIMPLYRIYSHPDHPDYGAARRLHIMLMQLFGDAYDSADRLFAEDEGPWDYYLIWLLDAEKKSEAEAHRQLLVEIINTYNRHQ